MTQRVLHVDNVKGPLVSLSVGDHAHSAQVTATSHHNEVTHIKSDIICDLARGDVDSDSVVDFDLGVRVADGSTIVSNAVRDFLLSHFHSLYLPQLVLDKTK